MLQFHRAMISLTIVFLLRVRLWTLCAQRTCHVLRTRLSRIPVPHITCHQLMYSYVPDSRFMCFPYCTDMDCRLVPGHLFVSRFPVCLVDSYTYVSRLYLSPSISSTRLYAYHYHLCLSFCSLSTRLPSCYFWTLTCY